MSTKKVTQALAKLEKISKSSVHDATNIRLLFDTVKTLISGKGIRLSEELEDSLVDAFKNHIAPFYELAPAEALSVAAASANYIFERKVRDKLPKRMREGHNLLDTEIVRWQQIIDRGILSGILDYVESSSADRDAVGICTYPAFLNILKSAVWTSLDYALKNQLLGFLVDTSRGCPKNKSILTNRSILSTADLAKVLSLTNEYVVMDPLLELMARLVPSINHKKERNEFIQGIFHHDSVEKAFGESTSIELGRIFDNTKGESIAEDGLQLIRLMGARDQRRPQAFEAKNITANGIAFIQPNLCYVFIDKIGIIANVGSEEEGVETLIVVFESIQAIHFIRNSLEGLRVLITLHTPPLLQYRPLEQPNQSLSLFFDTKFAENAPLRLALAAHGMQSKIFDSSTPVSAGKHPRASQTAAPIDLIGPKTQASGHASSKVKESEMARVVSSPIDDHSENDKSFQGITKFDPFPSAVESTFAEGKKSSKPLRSLSHDGADLVPQNEGILPPFSPSPASRSRTTATRSSNGSRVSQNSRPANSTLEVTRKRPTGVGDEKTSAKRRRLESPKRPSGTSPKSKPVTFSPSTSRSGQKIHKSSNKKRGRLPAPPALSDQLSTDFGIVLASQPELNRRPRPTPLAKHPRSSPHTSPIIPETDDILREAEGVTIPPTRRGRVSNMINEDGSEDTPGTNDPKVITPRADSPPKSASFAMTESALEHSEPVYSLGTSITSHLFSKQTGVSEGPSGKTHTIHVKVEDSLIDGNDGTPEVSKKRKNKKAPWEQPNFPSSDPPNKFDIRLPPEPRYAAPQVGLMDGAIKDSKAGPARIEPISGSVDLNEALETSAPLSHRKPTMPRSPAPAKTVSERDRSELHVSRSTKRSTSFDIGKETPGEPTRSLSAAMAVWDPTHNTSSNKGGLWNKNPPADELLNSSLFLPVCTSPKRMLETSRRVSAVQGITRETAVRAVDWSYEVGPPDLEHQPGGWSLSESGVTPIPIKSALKARAAPRSQYSVSFANSTTLHSPIKATMAVTSSLKPLNPNLSNKHSDESVLRSMPKASKSTKGFSGTLADNDENWALSVTSILNQICDRVVEAKRRQFQGIRQSVLIARSEILEEIQEDLRHCLTVSIDHYNCLLELNSQYDAAERDVKSAYDELNHVNTAITEKLQEIIRDHDRLSLCKAMTTLKSLSSRKAISATFESLGVLDGH